MTSFRAGVFKAGLKLSRLLRTPVYEQNLKAKRRAVKKFGKYFPVANSVAVSRVKTKEFKGEWIIVPEARREKVMLYFHGGGFVFNSTILHRDLIARIARAGNLRAFSVDYSLAPENRFPKVLAEAMAAYRWLLRDTPAKDIVIAGDSAGGSLTLSLLHQIQKEGLPNPTAAVVIAPATDGTMSDPSFNRPTTDMFLRPESLSYFIDSYFGPDEKNHPVASPLYGDFTGFPPLLVHVDKDELLYSDSARVVSKARKAGVDVEFYETEGLWHVWHLFARYIPEARTAIDHIGQFIQMHTRER
jgi:monoterpene epsilon-lactone hydrolase